MEIFYTFVELFATFFEGVIVFCTIGFIAGFKSASITKRILFLILDCTIYTIAITWLNTVQAFSFVTIGAGVILSWLISSLIAGKDFLYRAMATAMAFLILLTLDYIIGFSCAILIGKSPDIYTGFNIAMSSGFVRTMFTLINKTVQLLICFMMAPFYRKLQILSRNYQIAVLLIVLAAHLTSSMLLSMIMSESHMISQTAILISWFFILICVVAIIVAFCMNIKFRNEKQENELISSTNNILKESYIQIANKIEALHKQSHDYKNHLLTIRHLNSENVDEYINSLLHTNYTSKSLCRTGDRYVDAVLNCKLEEAHLHNIDFSYTSNFPKPLSVDAVDICAILSNQLDNAIEACCKMEDEAQRWIRITLDQKMDFTVFIVENSIIANSVDPKAPMISSKTDTSRVHGLGIKNIQKATEKYNGTLTHTITEDSFKSTALMQCR